MQDIGHKPSAIVLGAGLAGLTTAEALQRQGWRVRALEKSAQVGGVMQTHRQAGYLVEAGPNTLQLTSRNVATWLAEIGLEAVMQTANPAAAKRFIVRDAKPQAMPRSLSEFLATPWMSTRAKLRLLAEPFARRADSEAAESLATLVRRRMGQEWLDYAINPFVAGVYAGDPAQLIAREAFPRLWALEQRYGSFLWGGFRRAVMRHEADPDKQKAQLVSFAEGLVAIPQKLAQWLGEAVTTGVHLEAIQQTDHGWEVCYATQEAGPQTLRADALIITTPAHVAAQLPLPDSLKDTQSTLAAIPHPPVTSVALGYRREAVTHPLDGFGMLVPEKEQRHILGTLFSSTLFPGRAPEGEVLLTTYVGGSRQPEIATMADDALLTTVHTDLQHLLGLREEPVFHAVTRWPHAIPQYTAHHATVRPALEAAEARHPGLFWAGNYQGGIALTQVIQSSLALAARLAASFPSPSFAHG